MPYVYVPPGKPEFDPLLSTGMHPMEVDAIRHLCVDQFSLSKSREQIMCGLEHIVAVLRESGIQGKLWIDGSFLTESIDPNDVDVVLCMQSAFADAATIAQNGTIEWFQDAQRVLHRWLKCHAFAIVRWPENDANYWNGEYWYAYWLRQWGFSRLDASGNVTLKGIAVIELKPGGP
jgi:hypothetical protein